MKKAVLYARVSTTKQSEQGVSIEAQLNQLKDYAAANGYQVVKEYVDRGESAKTSDRPAFQEMISDIKSDPDTYNAVLIHKTDRFARNREDSIVYKSLLRRDCDVDVISIKEDFGDGAVGKMVEGIMEVVAEFYSDNLAKEVEKGQYHIAKQGKAVGKAPIGYKIGEDGKYRIDQEKSKIVKRIFQKYINGQGTASIALDFNRHTHKFKDERNWSDVAINNILKNEAYTGVFTWQDVRIENNHPAIISREDFELVQELLQKRKKKRSSKKYGTYLLQGVARCYECGGKMHRNFSNQKLANGKRKRYVYLRCTTYSKDRTCYVNHHRMEDIEDAVIQAIDKVSKGFVPLDDIEIAKTNQTDISSKYEGIKERLEDIDSRFDKQMEAFEAGVINLEQLKKYQVRLEQEKEQLQNQIKELEGKLNDEIDKDLFIKKVKDVKDTLVSDNVSIQQKKNALHSIVKEIKISKKQELIEILYKF
ncbi:recombinase family protein [Natroniella acetigena]|uniref:recombinase family protein n=1 Tax=Natroniella acetigena TaxID=52004 RepID=UPI00200A3025|nr:recombinase family protein [Natroniella acetigena]MCK8828407.1 recombinase family protein [Natroniella acetigena]